MKNVSFSSVARRAPLLVIAIAAVALGGALFDQAAFRGTSGNDLAVHVAYANVFRDSLARGELGLDAWVDNASLGAPVFRWYQHLPHLLAAALARVWPAIPPVGWIQLLLVAALVAQIPLFARCARRFGISGGATALAAVLALAASSARNNGNELTAYLFFGQGLFTQAAVIPFFLLALGSVARACGLGGEDERAPVEAGLTSGLAMALCFHCHPMYAYYLLIFCGVLAIFAPRRPGGYRRVATHFALAGLVSMLACSYQLRTLWRESIFLRHSFWDDDFVWQGHGWRAVLRQLFAGELLDARRKPALSALLGVSLLCAVYLRRTRALAALLVCFVLSLLLLAGPAGIPALRYLPGLSALHADRATTCLHVFTVLLCALGAEAAGYARSHRVRMGLAVLLWSLAAYLAVDRSRILAADRQALAVQRAADSAMDRGFLDELRRLSASGNVWAGAKDTRFPAMIFGRVGLHAYLLQAGIPQVIFSHSTGFTANALPLFSPFRPETFPIFNVVALGTDRRVLTSLAPETYHGDVFSVYSNPTAGRFDVIRIVVTQPAVDETRMYGSLIRWARSPAPGQRLYPALVPDALVRRYPQALPPPSPPGARGGQVLEVQRFDSGHYSATLRADSAGNYGMLRTAYHPDWRVRVNDRTEVPRWVSPGFLAFPLDEGVNRVELTFPEDRVRTRLFWASLAVLLATAVFTGWTALARRAVKSRHFQHLAEGLWTRSRSWYHS